MQAHHSLSTSGIRDNRDHGSVAGYLRERVRPGAALSVVSAYFTIYAYEALKDVLDSIAHMDFLFGEPAFINRMDPEKMDGKAFKIDDGCLTLANRLQQKRIARECAEWIASKTDIQTIRQSNLLHGKLYHIDNNGVEEAILGSSNFTVAGLGLGSCDDNLELNLVVDSTRDREDLKRWFAQIWNDERLVKDVKQEVLHYLAKLHCDHPPEFIYYLTLFHLFRDSLDGSRDVDDSLRRLALPDTGIWNALYAFQKDGAKAAINKILAYNGCILADSVGLGKTFTALAVIKYYELRNKSVLVLCPKKLAENWTNYNANLTTNIFASDRFNYDVLAHTDLSRTKGESLGLRLDRINWGNYDLVVIDESHNFRNADYAEEKESRYQRLMRQVIREGVKTKVLMLSATPVNNRFNDLKNQLQLAYEGDSDNLAQHLNLSTTVEKVFSDAQRVFNEWSKLDPEHRTTDRILQMLDFDFFELLDSVTIARSRKHIQAFYDTTEIGAFPERRPPLSVREPLTDLPDVPGFNDIFEHLQALTLAVYTPLAYVFPSRRAKYEDLYNVTAGSARSNLGQAGREQGLKKLMTVNLLKRLESSVDAFRLTLAKIEDSVTHTLGRISNHAGNLADLSPELAGLDFDVDDEDDANIEALSFGEKIKIDLDDLDIESWQRDLWNDRETLRELLDEMRKVTPEHDLKLR